MTPVEILAEPGSTHDGRADWMLDLIALAKRAGCDAVKWQFLSSSTRLCERRHAPAYRAAYRLIEGSPFDWGVLVKETHACGLRAVATCYLPEDAQPIADSGVDALKIASFEAIDGVLLRCAAATGLPLMISTGMMSEAEVGTLLGRVQPDTLFHCVSSYPAPAESLNLRVLTTWSRVFRHHRVGFSDHSADSRTGAVAVASGAEVLEVHMRHPETPVSNADYATALSPDRLADYVAGVRFAELALGTGTKAMQPEEVAMDAYRIKP